MERKEGHGRWVTLRAILACDMYLVLLPGTTSGGLACLGRDTQVMVMITRPRPRQFRHHTRWHCCPIS